MDMHKGFWYLATPYTGFYGTRHQAWCMASDQTALLIRHGICAFSPIVHSHPVAERGGIDPRDHDLWLGLDEALMEAAVGMIRCRLPGWERSRGMSWEADWFQRHGKHVVEMQPWEVPKLP